MYHIEKSFKSDSNNPLALKLIADHFVKVKKFEMAQGVCEHGLQVLDVYRRPENLVRENPNYRRDIENLKSDFYFILGKLKHI